jgi:hypothetical protein
MVFYITGHVLCFQYVKTSGYHSIVVFSETYILSFALHDKNRYITFFCYIRVRHFGKQIKNTRKDMKCAVEGWRRLAGQIV